MGEDIFKIAVFYVGTSISEEDAASIFVPDEGGCVYFPRSGVLVPGCTTHNTAFLNTVAVKIYIFNAIMNC